MKGIAKKTIIGLLSVLFIALSVNCDETYAKAKHNVTFIYGVKSVTVQVAHGANAPCPTDTDVAGYVFNSWVGNTANVTEDRVILGSYTKIPNTAPLAATSLTGGLKFNNNKTAPWPEWWKDLNLPKGVPGVSCAVHWYNGSTGELWKTDIVPYGGSLPDPGNPCISGYQFIGWEGDWTNVTEDRAIRAWYFVQHTVNFYDTLSNDRDWFDQRKAGDQQSAWVDAPGHDGYTFSGYVTSDGKNFNKDSITSDMDVYAIYKKD